MLTHATSKKLRLFTLQDIKSDRWQQMLPWEFAPSYLAAAWWVENFLCEPHSALGRAGAVCPFVKPAIERETLWLTGCDQPAVDPETLSDVILPYRDWFLDLPPQSGDDAIYKVILVVFPQLHHHGGFKLIDQAQDILKPAFVPQGLMVGQFHPFCEEPGVRSADFRPLRGPVAMLAIRFQTRYDLPFLRGPGYLREYATRFGHEVPEHLAPIYHRAMAEAGYSLD